MATKGYSKTLRTRSSTTNDIDERRKFQTFRERMNYEEQRRISAEGKALETPIEKKTPSHTPTFFRRKQTPPEPKPTLNNYRSLDDVRTDMNAEEDERIAKEARANAQREKEETNRLCAEKSKQDKIRREQNQKTTIKNQKSDKKKFEMAQNIFLKGVSDWKDDVMSYNTSNDKEEERRRDWDTTRQRNARMEEERYARWKAEFERAGVEENKRRELVEDSKEKKKADLTKRRQEIGKRQEEIMRLSSQYGFSITKVVL